MTDRSRHMLDDDALVNQDVILIVDDEDAIAQVLATLVEGLGYRAVCAPHGFAAHVWLRDHQAALVISDLDMPYMDGWELRRAIVDDATRAGLPPIPMILMTAQVRNLTPLVDATPLLLKPFDLIELETAIALLLPHREPLPLRPRARRIRRFHGVDLTAF